MSPHMYVLLVLTWRRLCGFSNWWSKSRIPAGEYHKSEVVVVFLFFVCLFFCSILKKKQQQQKKQELTIRLYRTTICSSLTPGGGGGGYSWEFLVGACHLVVKILTLFQAKQMSFSTPTFRPDLWNPYPFSDLAFQTHFEFAYFTFFHTHLELKP